MKLVIVSGLSGSGKTIALHTLEDFGYYCVDNLPLALLEPFARHLMSNMDEEGGLAAVGIDARNHPRDLEHFGVILRDLRESGIRLEILFLKADEATLLKRFSETRRKHPLSGEDLPLADAIARERELLEPLSAAATLHIDTTHTNIHQLRELVRERVVDQGEAGLSILFESFGFKHGVPDDADFLFDVRCLPNPHWEASLRPLTGLDRPVAEFLEARPEVERMYEELRDFLTHWIPAFERENRRYLTVALGCTGGQHRSVYLANRLGEHFRGHYPSVLVKHRELT
ncbi:MAG TPA: RNase adapter RapZ [Thiotrichales bacterium]|nr:RNase adapter RapZ [Thiotrichales bacterium]